MKLSNKNRLSIVYPELCKEWDYEKNIGFGPEDVSYGSHKRVGWKCGENHRWEESIIHRSSGVGCPYCSHHRVSDKNRLSLVYPELCKEWDYEKNGSLRSCERESQRSESASVFSRWVKANP